jgi:hypothetical protein
MRPDSPTPEPVDLSDMALDDVRRVLRAVDAWLAAEATAAAAAADEAYAAFCTEGSYKWTYHYGGFSEAQAHTAAAIQSLADLDDTRRHHSEAVAR